MIYDVEFSESIEEPRPRTFHHTAVLKYGTGQLTLAAFRLIAQTLAAQSQIPPWAAVQVSSPCIYVYWQTTDAGSRHD